MQPPELREYRERRGWGLAGEYVDPGVSGAEDSRPELNRLMAGGGGWVRVRLRLCWSATWGGEIYSFAGSLVASCQLLLIALPEVINP
jgi:hypothetical protein